MNLFGKLLFKMAGVAHSGSSYSLMDAALGKFIGGNSVSKAGVAVSQDAAMRVSAAWSCNRILSETFGCIPWGIYERDSSGNMNRVTEHPLSSVLVDMPNANMTDVEYREAKMLNLTMNGNSYSYIERGASDVVALTPIEASNVDPKQRDDGTVYYRVLESGKWVDYPQEEIWHVKGFGRNGLTGLSPLGAAREAMGMSIATEEFGSRFFLQGGMPSGIVTTDKFLNKDQRDIARENLQQMMGGLGNAHKFALFEGGMKPEPWASMPLEDMQFLLLRKFSIQEICRFYRIPPHMVADLDRATFSNIEHMSQEFVMFTMMPYFTRFEASVRRWLMNAKDRQRLYLRFNFEGLLRADSAGRAEFLSKMLQNGVMTRNEARGKENLNRSDVEGMDDYTVQSNMTVVSKLEALADSQIEKAAFTPSPFKDGKPTVIKEGNVRTTTTMNVLMPETKQQKNGDTKVEINGLSQLAASVSKAVETNGQSMSALIVELGKIASNTASEVRALKTVVGADRTVIYDRDGNPVGTRIENAD